MTDETAGTAEDDETVVTPGGDERVAYEPWKPPGTDHTVPDRAVPERAASDRAVPGCPAPGAGSRHDRDGRR